VPPGAHDVELFYSNPAIRAGALLSALAALALATVLRVTRPR